MEKGEENFCKAMLLYTSNVRLAEAIYPVLHALEVALRTYINSSMIELESENWIKNIKIDDSMFKKTIEENKAESNDMIVNKFSFGQWIRIFEKLLKKADYVKLIDMFDEEEEEEYPGQDELINGLSEMGIFRNKVFHHVPILDQKLEYACDKCHMLLKALSSDRFIWCNSISRFNRVYDDVIYQIEKAGIEI